MFGLVDSQVQLQESRVSSESAGPEWGEKTDMHLPILKAVSPTLLPCTEGQAAHIDLQDIHYRWLKVYWRGDYTPIKKHDNFIGVVMNERIEAILQEGRSSLMDVGFLALDEADPPDTIETPAPLPKHDYFSEVMRKVKALITTADTGNQRRDALMRMLDEAQLQLDEMPIDIATRPIPRHKASYERN